MKPTSKLFTVSVALGLSACATLPSPTPTSAAKADPAAAPKAAAAPATPSAPAAAPAPGAPRPFAEVIKEAAEIKGLFTLHRKDDKLWMEVPPELWGKSFAMSINMTHGLGERGLYGNSMRFESSPVVTLRRQSDTLAQLISLNMEVRPRDPSTAIGRAVERSFSDSLVAALPVVSAPHPERKSVLIELNPLLLSDAPGAVPTLEAAFRQSYGYDARNSSIDKVRNTADQLNINVRSHYALARLNIPPATNPLFGWPGPLPTLLPDIRSLFLGFSYSFMPLPATPMAARLADPRVGYFTTNVFDFTNSEDRQARKRFVNRWRLEKKDPSAAMSEPKQPIVFWLDANIPEKYREPITRGVLLWNKAFERIGFKDAVVVKQQQPGDDFDTSDIRHASIRWIIGKDVPFGARGPSITDPRTGEILDADIEMSDDMTRIYSSRFKEDTPRPQGLVTHRGHQNCDHADHKIGEMAFGLEVLSARGEMVAGSPEADKFVADGLVDITAHEVGHTLGLRHNFRASTAYTEAQVTDPEFVKANGYSASVMDYNPLNLALPSQRQGPLFMPTLGAYDYWAIEYGYRPLAPENEVAELAKIAGRSNEPLLAFGTDEDAGGFFGYEGVDPEVNRSDLTATPLAHYRKRVAIVNELWEKLAKRTFAPGESYELLRRNFDRGFTNLAMVSNLAAKYIGGVSVLRDHAGSGRAPLTPTPMAQQREALALLADNVFSEQNFKLDAQFVQRMSIDFDARSDSVFGPQPSFGAAPEMSIAARVLSLQRTVLAQLVHDATARRIVDAPEMLADKSQALTINELYSTLDTRIWSELQSNNDITSMRRALQREHVRWIVAALQRASGGTPGDARVLLRANAKQLMTRLDSARKRSGLSVENRAHLDDAFDQLDAALKAGFQRAGA